MLSIENYDVQATRREARAEAERERQIAENRLMHGIKALVGKGYTITEVANIMSMSESDGIRMLPVLA